MIRTAESVSPVIAEQVALTLIGFIVVYSFIFGAGSYYILRLIGKGPAMDAAVHGGEYYERSMEASVTQAVLGGATK